MLESAAACDRRIDNIEARLFDPSIRDLYNLASYCAKAADHCNDQGDKCGFLPRQLQEREHSIMDKLGSFAVRKR